MERITNSEFMNIVADRYAKMLSKLDQRNTQYNPVADSKNTVRLASFIRMAEFRKKKTSEKCLDLMDKHLICLYDQMDAWIEENKFPSLLLIDELMTDLHNYLLLLEACLLEEFGPDIISDSDFSMSEGIRMQETAKQKYLERQAKNETNKKRRKKDRIKRMKGKK